MKYERGKKNWITGDKMTSKFKIVESVPDKNGVIIIAIKPDENGSFNSRDEALDFLHQYKRAPKKLFEGWGSAKMIGNVDERFKQLERYEYQWRSFYAGWIEGRGKMYSELLDEEEKK
jgi:hypothetical protein